MNEQRTRQDRILILCTGNSARSIMAEAWIRQLTRGQVVVASAGSHPRGIHPLTLQVMAEAGLDVSGAQSESLDRYLSDPWDYVITVCDNAAESCPIFPGPATRLHWPFDDPPAAPEGERLNTFRRVRDEIGRKAADWLASGPRVTP